MRAIIVLVAAAWTLCACSSPYLCQKEVGTFSSSIVAVSNGMTQGFDNLDQDQAAADLAQVLGARAGVDLDPVCGDEETTPRPCRVMVHGETPDADLAGKFADLKPRCAESVCRRADSGHECSRS
jgi:hypothetical protein